jgi:hypothetical protein
MIKMEAVEMPITVVQSMSSAQPAPTAAAEMFQAVTPVLQTPPPNFDVSFYPGRRLTTSVFNGQFLIHVREYMRMGDRDYPTKKGVCFTPGRLKLLREKMGEIDLALTQQEVNASCGVALVESTNLFKTHLGAGIYVSVDEKYSGVDFRRYWIPERKDVIVPTRSGIFLPISQWASLKQKLDMLLAAHPELLDAKECALSHDNQFGMIGCHECMPFGWINP